MVEYIYSNGKKVRSYTLPENYNELTKKQVLGICRIFLSNMPVEVAQLEALRVLIGVKRLRFSLLVPLEAKAGMLNGIDWVFEKNRLTNQVIPKYKGFYGPASDWDNLTMAEWSDCEVYYERLVKGQDINAIDNIIAILYRRPKQNYDRKRDPDGDFRCFYNHNENSYWAKKIAKWPEEVKMAILTWYDGCREFVVNSYDVFEPGTTNQEKKAPGMFELIRGMCGVRYGGFDDVARMNVHKALREMELMKAEAERLRRSTTV